MGSRPHFRARPINNSKPLPIIKSDEDPFYEDDVNNQRDVPQVPTGMEAHETEEVHLKKALRVSVFGSKKPEGIPLPIFSRIPQYKEKRFTPWHRPQHHIIFDRTDEDLMENTIDYSLDAIDDKWYNSLPERKRGTLTPATLEIAIDTLERLQGRDKELVPFHRVKSNLEQLIPNDTTKLTVYNHWLARREELDEPLHRLFKPPVDPQEQSPTVAFRPRHDSASSARRQNTYENYKRLAALAPQFYELRDLLSLVQTRENLKASAAAVKMFQTRIECARASARTASAFKALCTSSFEVALVAEPLLEMPAPPSSASGPASPPSKAISPLHVPLRSLDLPESVRTGLKIVQPPPRRRRSKGPSSSKTTANGQAAGRPGERGVRAEPSGFGAVAGIHTDQYGYDDSGAKFMRHMRYFAGGFSNFGVCPYDHRVFSAASERNTVKENPREPRPLLFPTEIPFAKEVRISPHGTGGKHGMASSKSSSSPSKRIMRVRARVGRLGRLVLDRVVYEPERGVKAASYPASIDMGGVYTGGLPLEHSGKVLGEEHGEQVWDPLQKKLISPLEPITPTKRKSYASDDLNRVEWPSKRRLRSGRTVGDEAHKCSESKILGDVNTKETDTTKHPRYILSTRKLVEEV